MIYLVHRPFSYDIVGMSALELTEFLDVPDHKGLDIRVEMALEADEHECESADVEVPLD